MGKIVQFACLVGLRASEVIECVKLLNDKQAYSKYYNPNRQALEHFRFPEVFIRQTKKAYISFVTPEIIKDIQMQHNVPSRVAIMKACQRRKIKTDFHLTRKIFASWLRKEGIQPEVVDLLQGRVSQSILMRHYLVPSSTLKDDVLASLYKLQQAIE
jgi:intergrase/recombinase